jgi:hypothetical protein
MKKIKIDLNFLKINKTYGILMKIENLIKFEILISHLYFKN